MSRGTWIALLVGLLCISIVLVTAMMVRPEPRPSLDWSWLKWPALVIGGTILLATLIRLGMATWTRRAVARATTHLPTGGPNLASPSNQMAAQARTWGGPPWQVQILVAGFTVWTLLATVFLHYWPLWLLWTSLALLFLIYWVRWDVPGVQSRASGNLSQSVFIWAFLTGVVVVVVLAAIALFNFLFKDQEWHARVTPTMSTRVFPALNKLVGGKLLPTSEDPVDGISSQPVRPLEVRRSSDNTVDVVLRPAAQWYATDLSLYPSEAVQVVAMDSLYEVEMPGWRHTISVCGIAAGRQWYPSDLPVQGLQHLCLRATEPFGALLVRYGWDRSLPHYVGNSSRYTPSSRERREVYLALNLPAGSRAVSSSGTIVVRLRPLPGARK